MVQLKKWHKGLIIVTGLFIVYLLFGFFGLPPLTQYLIEKKLEPATALNIDIAEIKTNPLTFEIELNNIDITELDGQAYFKANQLYTDLNPAMLFKGIATVESIHLKQPEVNTVLDKQELNLLRPFAGMLSDSDTAQPAEESAMDWLILLLKIDSGRVVFTQITEQGQFQSTSEEISVELKNLQSSDSGVLDFGSRYDDISPVTVQGKVLLDPLDIDIKLVINSLNIKPITQHPNLDLPLTIDNGSLSGELNILVTDNENPVIRISNSSLTINHLEASISEKPLTEIASIFLNGIDIDSAKQSVNIKSCNIEQANISILKNQDGKLNITALSGSETDVAPSEPAANDWTFLLNQCQMQNSTLTITDSSVEPVIEQVIKQLNITVNNISLEKENRSDFQLSANIAEDSTITLTGDGAFLKPQVKARLELKNGPMTFTQGYLNEFTELRMNQGRVFTDTSITFDLSTSPQLTLKGEFAIKNFDSEHKVTKEKLLSWQEIKAHDFVINSKPLSISIPKVTVKNSDARIAISESGELNLLTVLKVPENVEKSEIDTEQPFKLSVDEIAFIDNKVRFSDDSLLLPFITHISKVNGNIKPLQIGLEQSVPSDVKIKGQIDQYGEATLDGTLLLNDLATLTELKLKMENIGLSSLSPYSGTFSGYVIDEGKLDTVVNYKVENQQLDSQNNIRIRNIKLGEILDEEKANSLPIEMAIALMEDRNGLIALDLPIHGDMNDPEFEYGHLIGQAIGNLIIKIVTAPFALLGSLAGSDDLQFVAFTPGDGAVALIEQEKLAKLSEALGQRPNLQLAIPLCSLEEQDRPALIEKDLEQKIATSKLGKLAYLEQRYSKMHGMTSLTAVKKQFTAKTKEGEKLDINKYLKTLYKDALKNTVVKKDAVNTLAEQRYQALQEFLTTKGKLKAEQIKQAPAIEATWKDDKLQCEFQLESGKKAA